MNHSIFGKITLKNGNVIEWLQFIDKDEFPELESAKIEAERIKRGQYKGMFNKESDCVADRMTVVIAKCLK